MKSFFLKDSVLKVVSFVLAIVLWFYVILVVDPSVTITVEDIPITYDNMSSLTDNGLTLIKEYNVFLELEIKGSRKKIVNIDSESVDAYVDLGSITKPGSYSLPVRIANISYEYEEITAKDPHSITVRVDRIVSVEKTVKIRVAGNVAEGYYAEPYTNSPEIVTLTGAESLVNKVKSVEATLNYSNRSADINEKVNLYFVDAKGNIIPNDDSIYDNVELDVEKVNISCAVLKTKKVPVKLDFEDVENYRTSVTPINVIIMGEADVLKEITEIMTEPIIIDPELDEQDIEVYLSVPEGVAMRDGDMVSVHVERRN